MMAREGATSFRGRGEIPSKAISLHFASFSGSQAQIQTNSASPPPSLSFHKSAEAPQHRRPQVGQRGLKPAADIAFKVDAT